MALFHPVVLFGLAGNVTFLLSFSPVLFPLFCIKQYVTLLSLHLHDSVFKLLFPKEFEIFLNGLCLC